MPGFNLSTQNFCFAGEDMEILTIDAQEDLKRNLLNAARERASSEKNPEHIQRYYYDALASFMNDYPSVQIDLILIKLDEFPLN